MKKALLWVGCIGLFFGYSFAYTPTPQDTIQIKLLKTQFDTITTGNIKDKADFFLQLKTLQDQFGTHAQLSYYLSELSNYLVAQVNNEKTKAKILSKEFKQHFVDQYSGTVKELTEKDSCAGWYNTIDTLSFANNFPTALTMATRYRETNCGYYLPNNGDGPFQILSKDYGTGQITESKFLQSIQDFIDFSKAKHTQYTTKLGINLTYTGFDFTGLVYHSALYNGATITGSTTSGYVAVPNAPKYVYDGFGTDFSSATRYGIVPKFLKTLDWELKNTY